MLDNIVIAELGIFILIICLLLLLTYGPALVTNVFVFVNVKTEDFPIIFTICLNLIILLHVLFVSCILGGDRQRRIRRHIQEERYDDTEYM